MFNTTTIPTNNNHEYNSFFGIFYILSSGLVIGASIIELFLYRMREEDRRRICFYDSSDDEEEEEEEEDYCDKYKEEFAALTNHKLSDEELIELNKKIVREQVTEKVEVIMTYDNTTETFCYYTDQLKEVSYPILETVARKFAIENNCKSICLQEQNRIEEKALAEEKEKAEVQAQAEKAQAEQQAQAQDQSHITSVFVKFKPYNAGKGSAPNFTSVVKVIEQMNHFRYRGKLLDYLEREKKVEEVTLDYSSYKKLLEDKKEK